MVVLDDMVAVITGGASGIGEQVVRALAENGADVVILDEDGERAADVAADVVGYSQQCDVSKFDHAGVGVSSAMARFGEAPRIVINCAALDYTGSLVSKGGKTIIPLFQRVMDVNVLGTYQVMSFCAQVMVDLPRLENGWRGFIINIVPDLLSDADAGHSARAAAASAVSAMTAPISKELGDVGISVNTVAWRTNSEMQAVVETVLSLIAAPQRTGEVVHVS